MNYATVDATVWPQGRMEVLSRSEVARLLDDSQGGLYPLLRRCALAVLNSGGFLDDGEELLQRYPKFRIQVAQNERGIRLELSSAPAVAFVDGRIIRGIGEHLFAVLRDIISAASSAAAASTWKRRRASPTRCSTSCATPTCCGR